jgi:cytochrome c nitrite reductase small subunit
MSDSRTHISGLLTALVVGTFVGVGSFTFFYAEGISYFSTDPSACANCHVMQPNLDSWIKSSHSHVAACNDCHLPSEFVPKYIAKADNGWRHSWAFTFQNFHEPIQMHPRNSKILQERCVECHSTLVHELTLPSASGGTAASNAPDCVSCHRNVGHGPTR